MLVKFSREPKKVATGGSLDNERETDKLMTEKEAH